MDDLRRVHCTFCGQTYYTGEGDTCDLCRKVGGLVDPSSPEDPQDFAPQGTDEAQAVTNEPASASGVSAILEAWRTLKLALLGIFCVGTGFWLMLRRTEPADPEASPTFGMLAIGMGIVAFGVFMVVLAVRSVLNWGKEE